MSVSLDNHLFEVQEEDIFPTFQKLRDILLSKGIGMKCYGAMRNAHQSGMMSTSNKVYILTLGKPALKKDIANTDIISSIICILRVNNGARKPSDAPVHSFYWSIG